MTDIAFYPVAPSVGVRWAAAYRLASRERLHARLTALEASRIIAHRAYASMRPGTPPP